MGTLASGSIDLKSLKVAGEANKYITKIDEGGIKIHDAGDLAHYMQLDATGTKIYLNNNNPVASFTSDGLSITPSWGVFGPQGFFIQKTIGSNNEEYINVLHRYATTSGVTSEADHNSFAWGDGLSRTQTIITSGVDEGGNPYSDETVTIGFYPTRAVGNYSFAQGAGAQATGDYSAALGLGVKATGEGQLAIGRYNKVDADAALIIGNGQKNIVTENGVDTSGDSNIFTIKKNGDLEVTDGFKIIPMISGSGYLQLDYHSLQLVDRGERQTYFHVSDLRNVNGIASIKQKYLLAGSTIIGRPTDSIRVNILFDLNVDEIEDVYYNSSSILNQISDVEFNSTQYIFTISDFYEDKNIVVQYKTRDEEAKMFTFGDRQSNSMGPMSVSFGIDNDAGGYTSYTEGIGNTSNGAISHAEGYHSRALGIASHAEGGSQAIGSFAHAEGAATLASGDHSHAEGVNTEASYYGAHAEGSATLASGRNAHAQNEGTIAQGLNQTVIGKYNIAQGTLDSVTSTDYAFIIGNGTGDEASQRSNALTVDWNGNVDIADGAEYRINGTNIFALTTPSISISTSTGTLVGTYIRRSGNVVQLTLTVRNTSSVASGSNIYEGDINTTALRPIIAATGATFHGSAALNGMITAAGKIYVRNASNAAKQMASDGSATISFTYLVS